MADEKCTWCETVVVGRRRYHPILNEVRRPIGCARSGLYLDASAVKP